MEYTIDMLISYILFAIVVSMTLITVLNTVVAVTRVQVPVIKEYRLPNSLEIVATDSGYVVRSERGCLVYVVVVNSEGYKVIRGLTPLEVQALSSDWVIAFTTTTVSVKVGIPLGTLIVSRYGVVVEEPIPPYVIINGANYQVVPNFEVAEEGVAPENSAYFIKNGTVVLGVRG